MRTHNGRLHELDVIVLATGFNAHQFMRPMNIVGRNGLRLESFSENSNRPWTPLNTSIVPW